MKPQHGSQSKYLENLHSMQVVRQVADILAEIYFGSAQTLEANARIVRQHRP